MVQEIRPKLRIGDSVRVRVGARYAVAEVLELRGDLGHGDRIVRVRLRGSKDPVIEFDAPESSLELSPMRSLVKRKRRAEAALG